MEFSCLRNIPAARVREAELLRSQVRERAEMERRAQRKNNTKERRAKSREPATEMRNEGSLIVCHGGLPLSFS
jgi:hypothetical protein